MNIMAHKVFHFCWIFLLVLLFSVKLWIKIFYHICAFITVRFCFPKGVHQLKLTIIVWVNQFYYKHSSIQCCHLKMYDQFTRYKMVKCFWHDLYVGDIILCLPWGFIHYRDLQRLGELQSELAGVADFSATYLRCQLLLIKVGLHPFRLWLWC